MIIMLEREKRLLLPALRKIQQREGYITEKCIKELSKETGVPVSRIYGVATFYSMLHTKKQPKNIIYLCSSPSCFVNGSFNVMKFLKKKIKGKKIGLYSTSCIGCCDEAPAMLLNGKVHTKLTEKKLNDILKKCRS